MGPITKLDLTGVMNHKMAYGKNDVVDDASGVDGDYLDKDVLTHLWERSAGNLFRLSNEFYDNIECDGQTVSVNAFVTKLHFLGFFFWGNNTERVTVEYADGYTETVSVTLEDCIYSLNNTKSLFAEYSGEGCETLFATTIQGNNVRIAYFHHAECELRHKGKVSKLVLPQNLFMHVFAITIEG